LAKKTESKLNKTGTKKTKKAEKAEKGERYYCEVCGCEIECIEPSTEAIVCCNEPMLLVCE
jgi:desulfoferrodoxin-like iron-binding protein